MRVPLVSRLRTMTTLATILLLLASASDANTTPSLGFGSISGRIVVEQGEYPLEYAHVTVLGTFHGATSRSDGSFFMRAVPAGTYNIKAIAYTHFSQELAGLTVEPSETLYVEFRMPVHFINDAAAAAESIGVDVSVDASNIHCRILLDKKSYRVGETPSIQVRMRNESDHEITLVMSTDGSGRGARYPHAEIEIFGPEGGFQVPELMYCGTLNGLRTSDFESVRPGEEFDPFRGGWIPANVVYGAFAKPGRYTIRFRYSTDEPDIRGWMGSRGPRISKQRSDLFRTVPRFELVEEAYVDVRR